MKAAVLRGAHEALTIENLIIDKPKPNEVLIRVAASGLCHSDMHFIDGHMPIPMPVVIGHEAAGIVEEVGSEIVDLQPGDHVVACASIFCGSCPSCLTAHPNRCTDRPGRRGEEPATLSNPEYGQLRQHGSIGGFAEQMLVHHHALVKVPRELPLDRGALLGCGVTTGLGAVFNTAQVKPGSTVAVIGCGGIGLNVIQGARIAGAERIIGVDLAENKLELARLFGATDCLRAGPDVAASVKELSRGGVDYVFEAVGRTDTLELGLKMLAQGGALVVLGVTKPDETFAVPSVTMLWNELRILGSRLGGGSFRADIPKFASLYFSGRLNLDSLISQRIALEEINDAFSAMLLGGVARSVITFDDALKEAAAHA